MLLGTNDYFFESPAIQFALVDANSVKDPQLIHILTTSVLLRSNAICLLQQLDHCF